MNNSPIMTYGQWVDSMQMIILWNERYWHNYGRSRGGRWYVEDFVKGERIWLGPNDQISEIIIPVDTRWISNGNRNYSDKIDPQYISIGGDKWKLPTFEQMGLNNPPPPITEDENNK